MHPAEMLPVSVQHCADAKSFKGLSFTTSNGDKLPPFPTITYGKRYEDVPENKPLLPFSIIDFVTMPFECCASFMFQHHATSRLGYDCSNSRSELTKDAKRMHQLNKSIIYPNKTQKQTDAWSLQGVVKPKDGCMWTHEGCYLDLKTNTCTTSNKLIEKFYSIGNENNIHRAFELLKSGSILYRSIQCARVESRLNDNAELLLFKTHACLSMKTKVINTTESTDNDTSYEHCTACVSFDLISGELITCPHTICGCYDGRHACSHLLGFLCFVRGVQRSDTNQEQFERKIPNSPIALQSALTLIDDISHTDSFIVSRQKLLEENKVLKCTDNF